jgi:type I restriction enzyme R subunit
MSASEKSSVQNPLTRYAVEVGWQHVPAETALVLRSGPTGQLFPEFLRDKLIELNPGVVDLNNVDAILRQIQDVRPSLEGNWEALKWLRGQKTVYLEEEKRHASVRVLDFDNVSNNLFQVSDEWTYTNGVKSNRADVVFLVNGIPCCLVETKSATVSNGLEKAYSQVARYHEQTPELLAHPQVYDIPTLLKFYYAPTWNLDRKALINWKEEAAASNFEALVKAFFTRSRFLKLLQDWIVFYTRDDETKKIILKQHQVRAVQRVFERALDPGKKRALVWHTQGSGKTFTMLKVAELLLTQTAGGAKPTVLLIIDRLELESQLTANLEALGLGHHLADSRARLRQLLRADTRGLIVSMIHKFDAADAGLNDRPDIYVLIDEAHRSTGGDLGNYLLAALPNATLIGFTGTPIDKTAYGQGTFKTFGCDDAQGYLDKYSVRESIEDGTTLPIKYALAPNEIRVPQELLEKEFLGLASAEGITDIEQLNAILDDAVELKAFLKAPQRVKAVARFVAEDFIQRVRPMGYKAFLVAVDREACSLYKAALDALPDAPSSQVVFSAGMDDKELLRRHHLSKDQEKQVRRNFAKAGTDPEILIVTEKLLTGYDAPILYAMYLDKPMRDHVLLQALARVNRPYETGPDSRKPCGLVVDFVGIFERVERALAFDAQSIDLKGVIDSLDLLKQDYEMRMRTKAPEHLGYARACQNDKGVEAAVDAYAPMQKRQNFIKFYRELEALYDILSPDVFLRPFIDDMQSLTFLYLLLQNAYSARQDFHRELSQKTALLVSKLAESKGIQAALPPVVLDAETIRGLQQGQASPTKVLNLAKAVLELAQKNQGQPVYWSIVERAQKVLENYQGRQEDTRQALLALGDLGQETLDAKDQQSQLGMDAATFGFYWYLRGAKLNAAEALANNLSGVLRQFPEHGANPQQQRDLRAEVYRVLLEAGVDGDRLNELANGILEQAHHGQ